MNYALVNIPRLGVTLDIQKRNGQWFITIEGSSRHQQAVQALLDYGLLDVKADHKEEGFGLQALQHITEVLEETGFGAIVEVFQ